MPFFLTFVKTRMSQHLSYGFDVGRGFVAGEEEVRKLVDHMSDHKDIAKSLKQISDNSRLDVIRCLGIYFVRKERGIFLSSRYLKNTIMIHNIKENLIKSLCLMNCYSTVRNRMLP